jgi:hypothetical protein
MAIFGNMSITNAGQNLYAKAQAGKPINFTRMQLGSGQIGTQNPATLVSLVNPQYYVPISSISNNTDQKTATISGIIDNSGITQATYICEIGLWAQDPDVGEILYGYASAGNTGDYMAPATQGPYSWSYQINAAIGNAANVTATLSSNTFDYGVVSSDTSLSIISGANQRAINKNIDNTLGTLRNQSPRYITTTGSNNAYNVALSDVTALNNGLIINIVPNVDNTGASTLQVNALAVIPIKFDGADLNAGDFKSGKICSVIYDGTNFNLQVTADQFASQKADNTAQFNNINSNISIMKKRTQLGVRL